MPVIPPSVYYPLGTLENPSDTHLWPLISVCAPPPVITILLRFDPSTGLTITDFLLPALLGLDFQRDPL